MKMSKPVNPRRSGLTVPAHKMKFVEKSWLRDADILTFDLEDGVLYEEKPTARANIQQAIEIGSRGGADIWVRINSEPELYIQDLEACVLPGLRGVSIPKVETVEGVLHIEKIIGRLEEKRGIAPGTVVTHMAVETCKGYIRIEDIAKAAKLGYSMGVGQEDFARDLGIELSEGNELAIPDFLAVIVAKAYGLMPVILVSSMADFEDLDGLAHIVANSVKIGSQGASCIHPAQIPVLNKGFSPSEESVEYARRVVEIFEESKRRNDGAIALDGKMIDKPVVDKALKVLARQSLIDEFQAYKCKMVATHS